MAPPAPDRFERAGAAFARLCRTMATLRARCPWDREQTHGSLGPYLIEEAYELLEVLEDGSPEARREELGDVLFQVVFHAEIAAEQGAFDAEAVARGLDEKLVRRHPHVFGDGQARDWAELKAAERPERTSRLDGIPRSLPALLRALRTGERAAAARFDWPDVTGALDKVREEVEELAAVLPGPDVAQADPEERARAHQRATEEVGDLLFSVVNVCRHLGIDPEAALGRSTDTFARRFRWIEERLRQQDRRFDDTPLDQLDALWKEAKRSEAGSPPEETP